MRKRRKKGKKAKKKKLPCGSFFFFQLIYRRGESGTLYFSAAKAARADRHSLIALRGLYTYGLYVGLPHFIGPSVRMADFNAERYTLSANSTFSHFYTSLFQIRITDTFCAFTTLVLYQNCFAIAREILPFIFSAKSLILIHCISASVKSKKQVYRSDQAFDKNGKHIEYTESERSRR